MPCFSLGDLSTAVHKHELSGKIFVLDQRFVFSLATGHYLYIVYLSISFKMAFQESKRLKFKFILSVFSSVSCSETSEGFSTYILQGSIQKPNRTTWLRPLMCVRNVES